MSNEYTVMVPLYGYIEIDVNAENEDDAKLKAMDDCMNIRADCSEMKYSDHVTILPYDKICQGSTCYIDKPEMEVTKEN